MMRRSIAILALLFVVSCEESPNDKELCRNIYNALCERSETCGDLEDGLAECQAYYYESCRTMRLFEGFEPTSEERQACVDAVAALDCEHLDLDVEANIPEACYFLIEPPDTDGDADGDVDGDVDGDADGDADGDVDGGGDADADADGDS